MQIVYIITEFHIFAKLLLNIYKLIDYSIMQDVFHN